MSRLRWGEVKGLLGKPGKHGCGDNLWLTVPEAGRGTWTFRASIRGKPVEMGLGSTKDVPYAEACDAADAARKLAKGGTNPIEDRRARVAAVAEADAAATTFRTAAAAYVAAHKAGWRNDKHAWQWTRTLEMFAYPVIGDLPVGEITTEHLLAILTPIWTAKTETAIRVRGRIEQVLNYGTVRKWRSGPNPAAWRGHLQLLLPQPSKVRKVEHHAALPWKEMYPFMEALARQTSVSALALRFAVLTAARSGEVRGATWREIDLDAAVWSIDGARMKGGSLHRVPLAPEAAAILRQMAELRTEDDPDALVFPGQKRGRPLSDMSLTAALRRMGRGDLTAHGFRSTFRDWCAEATNHPRALAEKALAHALESKVEASYQRGDLLEKRRGVMVEWATYCCTAPKEEPDEAPGEAA